MNYSYAGIIKRQKQLKAIPDKLFRNLIMTLMICVIGIIIALVSAVAMFGYGLYNGILKSTPRVDLSELKPSGYSTFVYDVSGNQISKLVTSDSNRIYTTIDKVPKDVQHAFVAIEDRRFYEHKGIDPIGIARAAYVGFRSHDFSQGASTITQQLIKNNIFTNWVNETVTNKWIRKVQEQYLAQELEENKNINKDIILELYLNTINLGQGTLGIQAASKRYFGKDVSELTLSEGAVLAAIPQNPTKYNPITHQDNSAERRKKVLDDMLEAGFIDQKKHDKALADNVYSRITEVNQKIDDAPQTYFIDALVQQVMEDLQTKCGMSQQQAYYQLYAGGLSIYSTQDPHIQKICDDYVNNPDNFKSNTKYSIDMTITVQDVSGNYINLDTNSFVVNTKKKNLFVDIESATEQYKTYRDSLSMNSYSIVSERVNYIPQPQLSAVIIDNQTGAVKALIGGRGEKTSSLTFNRAVDSMRQPGSTFKVLSTYLPAFDTGKKTLASTQVDEAYNYSNGKPVHNYYKGYRGTCTLREGIEQSLNIVTVKTLTDITPEVGYEYLTKMGFTTLVEDQVRGDQVYTDVQQALALGGITYGVKNIELAGAYATIANYGSYNRPLFYSKVVDHDGNVLLSREQPTQVCTPATAYQCLSAMEDVITKGTGKVCQFTGQALAGKTGTTSNNKDVWFAGSTPYYTCTTWAGYDDNSVLSNAQERAMAKTAWHDIMESIHKDLVPRDFTLPEDIVILKICKKSGDIATDDCERYGTAYAEYFGEANAPIDECEASHAVTHYVPNAPSSIPNTTVDQQAAIALWLQQQVLQAQQAQQPQQTQQAAPPADDDE